MESENIRSGILNFWKIQGAQRVTFSILNLSSQMHNHSFFMRNFGLGLDEPGELFRLRFEFSMMELMSLALIVVSSHLTHWIPPRLDLWTALMRPNSIFILFLRILYFFGRFLYFYASFLYFLGQMYENP